MDALNESLDLTSLAEVNVPIVAELDTVKATARELLALDVGGVLTLNKATGDNINLYVGDVLFASGEVLVSEGILGVRIAELREPHNDMESGRTRE